MNEKLQKETTEIWDQYYRGYEKGGSLGNEYPREELVRFVSNLRKDLSLEGYFADHGTEHSIKGGFSGKALEFGFGSTANLRMLRDKGFQVHGLEVSREAVEYGRVDLARRGISGIDLDVWEPVKIPFEDHSLTLVCGMQCIYYCLELESFIDECHRVLEPGGSFLFSFFSDRHGYADHIEWTEQGYAKWAENHPNPRLRGCYFRQPKSTEELKKLFAAFDELRVFTCETDQLPLFQSWWNITGKKKR